jgi:hypothetical protein
LGYYIKKNEIGGTRSTYGEEERGIQDFGGETCGKRPPGRLRLIWEDNIKMDLQEVD